MTTRSSFIRLCKSGVRFLLPFAVTSLLLGLLLRLIDPQSIFNLLRISNPIYVALSFFIFIGIYLSRAVRLRQFQQLAGIPIKELFGIVSLHSFFVMILPVRSGELTLVYLLRKFHKSEAGNVLGILFLIRLFDLITIALSLATGIALLNKLGHWGENGLLFVIAVTFGGLVLGLCLTAYYWWRWVSRFLNRLLSKEFLRTKKWFRILLRWTKEVGEVMVLTKKLTFTLRLLTTSTIAWLGTYAMFWVMLYSMGVAGISFPEVIVGTSIAAFTSALPISALGNWGTLQLGWTMGFSALGMSVEEGIASGFAVHLWTLVFSTGLAIYSFIPFLPDAFRIKLKCGVESNPLEDEIV